MTELSRQVKAHKEKYEYSLARTESLFTVGSKQSTASDQSIQSVSNRAIEAMERMGLNITDDVLTRIDPKDTWLLIADENSDINANVCKLIKMMMMYWNNYESYYILDYLIRAYRVHLIPNTRDILLKSLLMYHDTKIFVLFVQLCRFNNENDAWTFLRGVQQGKVGLSRSSLIKILSKNQALLEILTNEIIQIGNGQPAVVNFVTTCIIEIIHLDKHNNKSINEEQLRMIYVFVNQGLKNNKNKNNSHDDDEDDQTYDLTRACCMVIASIAVKIPLNTNILRSFTVLLIKKLNSLEEQVDEFSDDDDSDVIRDVVSTLVLLVHSQKNMEAAFNNVLCSQMRSNMRLLAVLEELPQTIHHARLSFISLIVRKSLLCSITFEESNMQELKSFLCGVITHDLLPRKHILAILQDFLYSNDFLTVANTCAVRGFLRQVSDAYPFDFDQSIQTLMESLCNDDDNGDNDSDNNRNNDDKKQKYIEYFTVSDDSLSPPLIHGVFHVQSHEQSPTSSRIQTDEGISATEAKLLKTPASLLLALQHPKKSVRLAALQQYQIHVQLSNNKNDNSNDYTSLSHMAALCINDTHLEVRNVALKSEVVIRLCKYCSYEELEEQVVDTVNQALTLFARSPTQGASLLCSLFEGLTGAVVIEQEMKTGNSNDVVSFMSRVKLTSILFDAICRVTFGDISNLSISNSALQHLQQASMTCACQLGLYCSVPLLQTISVDTTGKQAIIKAIYSSLALACSNTNSNSNQEEEEDNAIDYLKDAVERVIADESMYGPQNRAALLLTLSASILSTSSSSSNSSSSSSESKSNKKNKDKDNGSFFFPRDHDCSVSILELLVDLLVICEQEGCIDSNNMQTLSTEVIRNLAYTISNASAPALKKVKAYTKCSLTDVLTSVVGTAPTSSLLLAEKLLIASLAAPRPSLVRQAGACLSVCFQLAAPLVLIKIAINDSDSNSKVVVLGAMRSLALFIENAQEKNVHVILLCTLLCTHYCSSQDTHFREVGSILGMALSKAKLMASKTTVIATDSVTGFECREYDVGLLVATIANRASAIKSDSTAIATVLNDIFTAAASGAGRSNASHHIAQSICVLLSQIYWSLPSLCTSAIHLLCQGFPIYCVKLLESLITTRPDSNKVSSDNLLLLVEALVSFDLENIKDKHYDGCIQFICAQLELGRQSVIGTALRKLLQRWSLTSDYFNVNVGKTLSNTHSLLYQALWASIANDPGYRESIYTLSAIGGDLTTVCVTAKEAADSFVTVIKGQTSDGSNSSDRKEVNEVPIAHGVHCLCALTEVTSSNLQRLLTNSNDKNGSTIVNCSDKEMAVVSSALSSLMAAVATTSRLYLQPILHSDFMMTHLLATTHHLLDFGKSNGYSVVSTTATAVTSASKSKKQSKSKQKQKKGNDSDGSIDEYGITRLSGDLKIVQDCLENAQSVGAQTAAVRLLRKLVSLGDASHSAVALQNLGQFLAKVAARGSNGSTSSGGENSSGFTVAVGTEVLAEMFETLVSFDNSRNAETMMEVEGVNTMSTYSYGAQRALEYIFNRLGSMPELQRSRLTHLSMRVLGERALAPIVGTLLAHCLACYDGVATGLTNKIDTNAQKSQDKDRENSKRSYILLSVNASRSALQQMRTSTSEEIFKLACDVMVRDASPGNQVSQLARLLRASGEALCVCVNELQNSHNHNESDNDDIISSICEEYSTLSFTTSDADDAEDAEKEEITRGKGHLLPFEVQGLVRYASRLCRDQYATTESGGGEGENSDGSESHSNDASTSNGSNILAISPKGDGDLTSSLSVCITLLEFVFEVLESKAFHRSLVHKSTHHSHENSFIQGDHGDTTGEGSSVIAQDQALLLFGEEIMRLLALCSTISEHISPETQVTVTLGRDKHEVSLAKVAGGAWEWSMDILDSLQRLMDTPSFIAILEELVQHDDALVRSRTISILTERLTVLLDGLDQRRSSSGRKHRSRKRDADLAVERGLYRDLLLVLRNKLDEFSFNNDADTDDSSVIGMDSGKADCLLLCIDILANAESLREGSKERVAEWYAQLQETLEYVLGFATKIHQALENQDHNNQDQTTGLVSILGSTLLCLGTLVKVLGPIALPHLQPVLQLVMDSTDRERSLLSSSSSTNSDEDEDEIQVKVDTKRAKVGVMLIRAAAMSCANVVESLPQFCISHISRIFVTLVPISVSIDDNNGNDDDDDDDDDDDENLEIIQNHQLMVRDVDACLRRILSAIPSSKCATVFQQALRPLMLQGRNCAIAYATLMETWFASMDRNSVTAQLQTLCGLCTLLLDYRRALMSIDDVGRDTDVDGVIISAVCTLILKFTEVELRQYLLRLREWKVYTETKQDENDENVNDENNWKKYARAVMFFRLLAAITDRLQTIFVPTMALLWEETITCVSNTVLVIKSHSNDSNNIDDNEDQPKKKRKKSKESKKDSSKQTDLSLANNASFLERKLSLQWSLALLRLTATHDNTSLINEIRFEVAWQSVVELLTLPEIATNDDTYQEMCDEFISPTLTALVQACGRDLLWKPLNHKLLLITRSSSESSRIAALKTLHRLFEQIGAEYLIFLPECIPFLSELLEDDSARICQTARETVNYVEALSGESLQQYWQ